MRPNIIFKFLLINLLVSWSLQYQGNGWHITIVYQVWAFKFQYSCTVTTTILYTIYCNDNEVKTNDKTAIQTVNSNSYENNMYNDSL